MTYRVGMVIPFQGPGGLYGPSAMASAELAVQEMNEDGGLLGQPVALQWVDGGGSPLRVASAVDDLIRGHNIDAIAGWHISSVRNALVPVVAGRVPYVYPALYEGGERRSGVYCTGEAPDDYLLPALEWFRDSLGVRRWFVIGDNYVWPRRTCRWLRQHTPNLGVTIADIHFVNYGVPDPEGLRRGIEAMQASHCDGVISLMIGQNAVEFNRAFGKAGLPSSMIRLCPLSDENVLLADGAQNNTELYAAGAYFSTLVTESALDLVGRYHHLHGDGAPALSGPAESCLESLAALTALVRRAGSLDPRQIDHSVDGLVYSSPRGKVRFKDNHVEQPVYLGRSDGLQFDIVAQMTG